MMKDIIRTLMPSAKTVAGALTTGALTEIGASLVRGKDPVEGARGLFDTAKDVALELAGYKELPGEIGDASTQPDPAKNLCIGEGTCRCKCNGGDSPCTCGPDCHCPCQHLPAISGAQAQPSEPSARKVPLAPRPARTQTPPAAAIPQIVVDTAPVHAQVPVAMATPAAVGDAPNGDAPKIAGSRTYLVGSKDTAAIIAQKYSATGRNWRAELSAANPGVDIDNLQVDRLSIPDAWANYNPSAVPMSGASASAATPASAAPVGATAEPAVRTMCTCAIQGGSPIVAGPGERIEFKQCDACKEQAIANTKFNLGMALGWAEAWKAQTGIDPRTLGESCGTRPDPNATSYRTGFGFDDRKFNADLAGWQRCAAAGAIAQAKAKMAGTTVGKAAPDAPAAPATAAPAAAPAAAAPAAAPAAAAPAAPVAPVPSPKEKAALVVSQQARRAEKHAEALKDQIAKAPEAAKAELHKEAERATELKHKAEMVADHLKAAVEHPAHDKIVEAVHEHADKGPEVMASMIPALYAMLMELPGGAAAIETEFMPPWGGPSVPASNQAAMADIFQHEDLDFPMADRENDLSGLPELAIPVSGTPAAAEPAAPVDPAPAVGSAPSATSESAAVQPAKDMPAIGLSMEPLPERSSEHEMSIFDESILEGLGEAERDTVIGYARSGYSEDEVREYAAMFRAYEGNVKENPGTCDTGCSIRKPGY